VSWFRISFAENAFRRVLHKHGWTLETLTIDDGVAAMLEFYTQHRAQHTKLDEDGDMLLVKWGGGQLHLVRQFIRSGNANNPMTQLSLRFEVDFPLPDAGDVWHHDPHTQITVPTFFTGVPTSTTLHNEKV